MTTSSSTTSSPPAASPSGEAPAAEPAERAEPAELAELDLTGEVCPYTFVRTRLALEALPLGAELVVTVDHAPAARNVPRSAAEWGQDVVGVVEPAPGRWTIRLRKRVS